MVFQTILLIGYLMNPDKISSLTKEELLIQFSKEITLSSQLACALIVQNNSSVDEQTRQQMSDSAIQLFKNMRGIE